MLYRNQIKIGSITTSKIEINDLLKAWLTISVAFAIVLSGGISLSVNFFVGMFISAFTVGLGFLLHELSHKFVAQRYGCFAEFRSFDQMLILAIIMSFFGFIFAAPGAVIISGPVGIRRNGKISVAGPGMNLFLAFIFLISLLLIKISFIKIIFLYGYLINTWLGLFNMIPAWNFDGKKILAWNKLVYGIMVIIALALMFTQGIVK
jgi:Zn-dependent protease